MDLVAISIKSLNRFVHGNDKLILNFWGNVHRKNSQDNNAVGRFTLSDIESYYSYCETQVLLQCNGENNCHFNNW